MQNAECRMQNEGVRSADNIIISEGNTIIVHSKNVIASQGAMTFFSGINAQWGKEFRREILAQAKV